MRERESEKKKGKRRVSRRSVSVLLDVCNSLSVFVDRQKQRPIDHDVDISEGWFARRELKGKGKGNREGKKKESPERIKWRTAETPCR